MFASTFRSVVSALTYSFVEQHHAGFADNYPPSARNAMAQRVLAHHQGASHIVRLPLFLLTLVFDWWSIVMTGSRFHRLDPARRGRRIARWKNSRIGVLRDFVRFYETLSLMSLLSFEDRYGAELAAKNRAEVQR